MGWISGRVGARGTSLRLRAELASERIRNPHCCPHPHVDQYGLWLVVGKARSTAFTHSPAAESESAHSSGRGTALSHQLSSGPQNNRFSHHGLRGASAGQIMPLLLRKRRSRGADFFSYRNSASAESRKVRFGRRILHSCQGSHHERCRFATAKKFDATHRVSPLMTYIETQAWPIVSTIAC